MGDRKLTTEKTTNIESRETGSMCGSSEQEPHTMEAVMAGEAGHGSEKKEGRSTWRAVVEYRKALLWSSFVGLSCIMWGYDMLIGAGLLSSPKFRQDFGYLYGEEYVLQAKWQVAFNTASSVGGFCGCLVTGYGVERIGRKLALVIACVVSCAAIFAQVFASSNGVLLIGKLINGVSLGSYLTLSSAYAAEACPVELRGIATSGVNLFMGIGELIANAIVKACGARTDHYAYTLPFALQWILPLVILSGVAWVPESPAYLIRKGLDDQAAVSLRRLGWPDVSTALKELRKVADTEALEQQGSSYVDCFRGTDKKRTEIAMGSFTVTQLTGCVFIIGYSTYFFELAGLNNDSAFDMGLGVGALGIVGNIFSWFLINSAGRRPTFLWGTLALFICLMLIGILDVVPHNGSGAVWSQSSLMVVFNCIYFLAVGPIAYALFAEISSSKLRSRTVALGFVVQNLFGILLPTVIPYLLNPDEANLKGKICFIFAFFTALSIVWIWFRVPETAGRSFEELDILFKDGVPARKFKKSKT